MWIYLCGVLILSVGVLSEDKSVTVGNYTTKVKGQSGKIALYKDGNETNGITITYDSIEEIDTNGDKIQSHSYNNFAQLDFTFSIPVNSTYGNSNVTTVEFNFTASSIPVGNDGTASLTSYVYIFTSDGNITVDNETFEVKAGDMKFNVEIENWHFCDTCRHGNKDLTGEYLDFAIEMKGKKTPSKNTTASTTLGVYDLGDGARVITPKQVTYNGNTTEDMPANFPKTELKGSKTVFIFRFKKFSSSVLYDPIGSLSSETTEDQTSADQDMAVDEVEVMMKGRSGKMTLIRRKTKSENTPKNSITIEFDNLREKKSDGSDLKDSKHRFLTFANQDFTFSSPVDETYPNTSALVKRITFSATLLPIGATLKVDLYIFKADANITVDGEVIDAKKDNIKFNIEITNWSFCSANNPCQQNEIGEYLDFDIVMKGSKAGKKPSKTDSGENKPDTYDLGSGTAILSKKIIADGSVVNMTTGYPMFHTQGSKEIFTFRFPKFTQRMYYDPNYSVTENTDPNNGVTPVAANKLVVAILTLFFIALGKLL